MGAGKISRELSSEKSPIKRIKRKHSSAKRKLAALEKENQMLRNTVKNCNKILRDFQEKIEEAVDGTNE